MPILCYERKEHELTASTLFESIIVLNRLQLINNWRTPAASVLVGLMQALSSLSMKTLAICQGCACHWLRSEFCHLNLVDFLDFSLTMSASQLEHTLVGQGTDQLFPLSWVMTSLCVHGLLHRVLPCFDNSEFWKNCISTQHTLRSTSTVRWRALFAFNQFRYLGSSRFPTTRLVGVGAAEAAAPILFSLSFLQQLQMAKCQQRIKQPWALYK